MFTAVGLPARGQRPQPGGRRGHERGGEQERPRRGDAEREPDGESGRDGPQPVDKNGLGAQRGNDERVGELRDQQGAQPAGRGGGCGSGEDGQDTKYQQGRVRQQAEPGERTRAHGQPGRQLDAGPLRLQPRPEDRGPGHLAEHVGGGEPGAQRIPAGAVADQEHEPERGHRDRKPGADGDERPPGYGPGGELAVTHDGEPGRPAR
jgi:hypothetical protein